MHSVNFLKKYERQGDVERWRLQFKISFALFELSCVSWPMTKFEISIKMTTNLGQIKNGWVSFVVKYSIKNVTCSFISLLQSNSKWLKTGEVITQTLI